MKVRLKDDAPYEDLTPGREYYVVGIEADDFRVIDDLGQPFLYSPEFFEVIDSRLPDEWQIDVGEDGERYAYPEELNGVGFFEDFFDRDTDAVRVFWQVMNRQLSKAA